MTGTDLLIVGCMAAIGGGLVGLWCWWTERPERQDWAAESGARPRR